MKSKLKRNLIALIELKDVLVERNIMLLHLSKNNTGFLHRTTEILFAINKTIAIVDTAYKETSGKQLDVRKKQLQQSI